MSWTHRFASWLTLLRESFGVIARQFWTRAQCRAPPELCGAALCLSSTSVGKKGDSSVPWDLPEALGVIQGRTQPGQALPIAPGVVVDGPD